MSFDLLFNTGLKMEKEGFKALADDPSTTKDAWVLILGSIVVYALSKSVGFSSFEFPFEVNNTKIIINWVTVFVMALIYAYFATIAFTYIYGFVAKIMGIRIEYSALIRIMGAVQVWAYIGSLISFVLNFGSIFYLIALIGFVIGVIEVSEKDELTVFMALFIALVLTALLILVSIGGLVLLIFMGIIGM